ncbi:DUF6341 family protein [Tenacibaculum maritimum]|uniref:DUF6341 family protein n=1 Tax=Tenacibaculum maritimum TaxID=107401 RepID=UPI001E373633|nr:hypothetical protein [Tenacibaculum maritimum]MCD9562181.1 hypothetical protein [Tenacibaculum maritimum]MCD9564672.1 hypothetical protein [Tenacibaculum maritimum]MCD9578402.1 hypothetical protein [Tenacibaculum maritimum]MCD9595372.1 hypothetical protein [Tenacibaculum maritimum]MCD9612586.1 hypothetical protein [Tenacibaculum maritimum]
MIAGNIFRLIGSLFTDYLFIPFNWLRLTVRNWWSTNTVNWIFLLILLVLFAYWMKEAVRFKNEGTEDRA